MSKTKKVTVERVHREIIENQILATLDDADKVACIFTKPDLDELIDALHCLAHHTGTNATARQAELLEDLMELRDQAFPEARP